MMWHYLSVYLYSVSAELSSPLPVCVLDTGCPCMSLEYFSPVRQAHLKQEEVNVNPYHTNGKVLFLWNSVLFSASTFEHLPWTSEISCSSGLNSVAFVTQQKIVKRKNGGKKNIPFQRKHTSLIFRFYISRIVMWVFWQGKCFKFSSPVKTAAKLSGSTVSSIL